MPSAPEALRNPHHFEVALLAQRFLQRPGSWRLIDVGANTGEWAERFLRLVPAEYLGIEPDARAAEQLLSRFPGGSIIQAAAGVEAGTVELHLARDPVYSSVSTYREFSGHAANQASASVDVVALDDVVPPSESGDIVKIDVQGAEADVIRGGSRVLSDASLVIVEAPLIPQTSLQNDLGTLCGLLRPLGLAPVYFARPGLRPGRHEIPIEHDVIFARVDELNDPASVLV